MLGSKSYIDIGRLDLKSAGGTLLMQLYNPAARFCQQYIEKLFKEFIYNNCRADDTECIILLRSHRLDKLADKVSKMTDITFSSEEKCLFHTLSNYYSDTNNPGDNYIDISEEEANRVYNETRDIQSKYEAFLLAWVLPDYRQQFAKWLSQNDIVQDKDIKEMATDILKSAPLDIIAECNNDLYRIACEYAAIYYSKQRENL